MSHDKIAISISLHDVSERRFERDRALLQALRYEGVDRVALMVIPAATGDAGRRRAFGEWLAEEGVAGRELFCHGLAHCANPELERLTVGRFHNKITAGEAEFSGLDRNIGQQLLTEALDAFADLGCGAPFGFTPPTWHAPSWLEKEAFRQGVTVYEKRFFISREGYARFSFPLSMVAGSNPRFHLSVATARQMLKVNRGTCRLALHPVDFTTEERRVAMMQLLEELLNRHRSASYAELLF